MQQQMQGEGGPGGPQRKKKGKKGEAGAPYGKLIQADKGNVFYRMVNSGYTLYMIVMNFSKKILWTGSCFAFLYFFPVGFEIFNE